MHQSRASNVAQLWPVLLSQRRPPPDARSLQASAAVVVGSPVLVVETAQLGHTNDCQSRLAALVRTDVGRW